MRVALMIVLLAAVMVQNGAGADPTPGSQSPSLIPFVGSFKLSATWGAPSGGYHKDPAMDVLMKVGTPVYAAGDGTVEAIKRDPSRCDPRAHGSTTAEGVKWCISHGFAESGTRIVLKHPDGRTSHYLHLSGVVGTLAKESPVRAGQPLGDSGNTGISEAPHLHYEERLAGKPVDPGTWLGCSGGKRVEYDRLQRRVNQPVANEGYGCLGITGPTVGPRPDPLQALVGTWSGMVTQNRVPNSLIHIKLRAPVASTDGVAEIPSSSCVGSMRYVRSDGATHRFSVTWPKGRCIKGIISLKANGRQSLSYGWEGRYDDGSRAFSSATLRRTDNLKVSFLGPVASRYSESYWADVTGARRVPSGSISVGVSATGRSDLRRPETSCLISASGSTKIPVRAATLSTDQPGRFVGELEFPALQAGTWRFQYSCQGDYSSPPILRVGG